MQIFEFHFNPKSKEDRLFDTFIYEPESSYEKRLGGLYIVGDLQHSLSNTNLLDNLSQVIKKKYYNFSLKLPDKSLAETLKKANEFLNEEIKKNNVNWLGNLNFAVLSLKDLDLNFTQTGDLKILLIRQGQIIDVSKNLNTQDIDPYPLKIFFNIVSGKLIKDDAILVLTKDVFDFFIAENLLDKISKTKELNKKNLKEILPPSLFTQGHGKKVSGICFIAVIKQGIESKNNKSVIFQEESKFSLTQALSPAANLLKRITNPLKNFRKQKESLKKTLPRKIRKVSILEKIKTWFGVSERKKSIALLLILFCLLLIGFLIFKGVEEIQQEENKELLEEIERKIDQAESFLIIQDQERANSLFKEAWMEILALSEKKTSLKDEILALKQSIENNLKDLNNLKIIENPEKLSGPKYQEMFAPFAIPENLIIPKELDFNLDIFASYLSNLYFLDKRNCQIIKYSSLGQSTWSQPKIWKQSDKHCLKPESMAIDSAIWILNEDNLIYCYHKGEYQETLNLYTFPFPENITKIQTNINTPYLYLLEPINKRIIVFDKEEKKIIKQFQSEKFNDLKDFILSKDGKTIYVLNNQEVYKIEVK